jgi:hypothetical protein
VLVIIKQQKKVFVRVREMAIFLLLLLLLLQLLLLAELGWGGASKIGKRRREGEICHRRQGTHTHTIIIIYYQSTKAAQFLGLCGAS